jgi:hypothetical protein
MSEEKPKLSFSWARRWSAGLNLLITVAAVLALVAMFNYLAIRHYTRFHLNRSAEAALSSRTKEVLASLTNTVKVIVYFDSQETLFPRVKGLLKEYQYASPRIQVEYVDYMRDVAAALKVKEDYKLTADNRDVIIFDSNGGKVVASATELSDYDYADLVAGKSKEVTRTHFKGELVFTSKIYSVAAGKKTVAYYMVDNGEHPVDGDSNEGYGKFIALLNDENNFIVRPLRLIGTNDVPTDCGLLIIAGPTTPLAQVELERIERYLEQGGRALFAFNQQTAWTAKRTGLEKLLEKWNVEVGQNVVVDKENSASNSAFDVVATELGAHPIMNPIRGGRVLLYMPRSIRALKTGNGRGEDSKVDELLFTGPGSRVAISPREVDPTQSGPKPLMAVVEKSVTGLQRGSTRIVVLGDSLLWGNNFIKNDANREFAAATANWLVNQSVLLNGIPPRALKTYKITLTQKQMRSVQWSLIAGLPGSILFIGLLVWLRRRY